MDKRRRSEFPDPGSKKTKYRDERPQSESGICSVQPTSEPFCNQVRFDVSSSAAAATSQAATVSDNMLREHQEFSAIPQRKVPVKSGLDFEKMLNANEDSVFSSLNSESTPSYSQRGSMVPQLNEKTTFSNCDSNCRYQQLADDAKSEIIRIRIRLLYCLQVASRANKEVEDRMEMILLTLVNSLLDESLCNIFSSSANRASNKVVEDKLEIILLTLVNSLLDESLCIMPEDACEHFKSASKLYYTFRKLVEELKKDAHKFRSALAPSLKSERRTS